MAHIRCLIDLKFHLAAASGCSVFRRLDLTRAQFDAFANVPLLYFILITNTIAVAYTYVHVGRSAVDDGALRADRTRGLRTLWWLRRRHLVRSDADILRDLRATTGSRPIAAGFTAWSFALYP